MSPRIGSRGKHPRDFKASMPAEDLWLATRAERERMAQEKQQEQEQEQQTDTTAAESGPKETE